jgi:hypothetical protein
MAFLPNHRDAIAAMDFFVVLTVTFRALYGWFTIEHGRRRVRHDSAPIHPSWSGAGASRTARRSCGEGHPGAAALAPAASG